MKDDFIEYLIDEYSDMIFRVCFSYTGNKYDAEDILQDVFLKCIEKQPIFNSKEHEKAWLITVAINKCKSIYLSAWKKRIVFLDENTLDTLTTFNKDSEGSDLSETSILLLEKAFSKLSSKQRLCIHLFYYENYSILDISSLTNIRTNSVKSHLFRAKKLIEKEFNSTRKDSD